MLPPVDGLVRSSQTASLICAAPTAILSGRQTGTLGRVPKVGIVPGIEAWWSPSNIPLAGWIRMRNGISGLMWRSRRGFLTVAVEGHVASGRLGRSSAQDLVQSLAVVVVVVVVHESNLDGQPECLTSRSDP